MSTSPRGASPLVEVVAAVVRWHPRGAFALFALASAGSLTIVVAAALLRLVVQEVLVQAWTGALLAALAVAAMYAGSVMIARVQLAIGFGMNERFAHHLDQEVLHLAHRAASVELLDSPAVLDQMQLVQQKRNLVIQAPYTSASLVALAVSLLVTAGFLVWVSPVMIAVAVLALPAVLLGRIRQTWQHEADRRYATRSRGLAALYDLLSSTGAAMEVRIFGLAGELLRRYSDLARRSDAETLSSALRGAAVTIAGALISALGYAAGVLIALRLAETGAIGLGDIVLVLLLALQLQAQITGATGTVSIARETGLALDTLDQLRRGAASPADGRAGVPETLSRRIELDRISYTYPGRPEPALRGVTLGIPAGSVVALAGDNGAGKSTLAAILTGLLTPTSGVVRVDEVVLSEIAIDRWRRRAGIVLQDFARFELLAGQVIGAGDIDRIDDEEAIWHAAGAAAADTLVRSWPSGLATPLGQSFADGRQLSGGEWQRFALGRGIMRRLPLVLVLDEPGAHIDAFAELELFERYMATAREIGRSTGAITIVISHRLSITAFADLVVFLRDGAVTEMGSPSELRQRGGEYAELFALQAAAYAASSRSA